MVRRSFRGRSRLAVWILVLTAACVFLLIPALQAVGGGSQWVWSTAVLLVAITGWLLWRWAVSPPRDWRNQSERLRGKGSLVLLRESERRESGVGALDVRENGLRLYFPDREPLFLGWDAITDVTTVQERFGQKWKLKVVLSDPRDVLVLYPLMDDGVSMAVGPDATHELLRLIRAQQPPNR